jgi:hypothetical protein
VTNFETPEHKKGALQPRRDVVEFTHGPNGSGPADGETEMIQAKTTANQEVHSPTCVGPGFRYAATIKATGKVVMFCKTSGCPAMRIV